MDHTVISTVNSTTTPLGSATEWDPTGRSELVRHYTSIAVQIESDVASDDLGVKFVWSPDGSSHFTLFPTWTYRLTDDQGNPISGSQIFQSPVLGDRWYLAFEKAALDTQSTFSVKTSLRYAPMQVPFERVGDYLDRQRQAIPVKSYPVNTNRATWSSTISVGGTSQQVMPARAGRSYVFFQNTSDTTMWLEDRGVPAVANACMAILPYGAYWETENLSPAQFNVLCATTGKTYVARDG